jgi:5-methylcytosine-specific restriction enzyme B
MPRAPWVGDAVYAAGEQFVEECLRDDGSLFTPGQPIWTPGTLDDFHERYVVHEKTEGGSFMERLQEQLEGAPDETIQLTAETLFMNYLCEDDTKAETKRRAVGTVLGWMASPVAVPPELDAAFSSGLAKIGLAKAQRWQQSRFLLEFMQTWKSLEPDRREQLLADAWEFRELVQSLPKHAASVQIEGLLHLVFPEPFESIVSPNHKRDVVRTFQGIRPEHPGDPGRADVDVR